MLPQYHYQHQQRASGHSVRRGQRCGRQAALQGAARWLATSLIRAWGQLTPPPPPHPKHTHKGTEDRLGPAVPLLILSHNWSARSAGLGATPPPKLENRLSYCCWPHQLRQGIWLATVHNEDYCINIETKRLVVSSCLFMTVHAYAAPALQPIVEMQFIINTNPSRVQDLVAVRH